MLNYSCLKLELQAIVYSVRKCRTFLMALDSFILFTDHRDLEGLEARELLPTPNNRVLRNTEFLLSFPLKVKYLPKEDITIYLWDDNNFSNLDPFGGDDPEYEKYLENWKPNQKGRDYTWLLNACRAATTVIMNMDYSSNQMKVWSGYILTMSKTWFINSNPDDASSFGVLNRNKINNMQELFPKIKKLKDSQ